MLYLYKNQHNHIVGMEKHFIYVFILLPAIFFCIELLFFLSLNRFLRKAGKAKSYFYICLSVSVIGYILFVGLNFLRIKIPTNQSLLLGYNLICLWIFPKIILLPFLLIGNLFEAYKRVKLKNIHNSASNTFSSERRKFIATAGWSLASLPFFAALWGYAYNTNNLRLRTIDISLPKFPQALDGFRIVHLSDLHFGSFSSTKQFENICNYINLNLSPDLIFITGDFVNYSSKELLPYIDLLNSLFARYGKFAVLGNHDHYANIKEIEDLMRKTNIRLLNNECFNLNTHAGKLQLVGIDNIGDDQHFGDIDKAFAHVNETAACLFLCHDPAVWDKYILRKLPADITFAGHTHGGQIAVPFTDGKLNPMSLKNQRVAGLYHESQQYLYVNTGVGTTMLNMRIGTTPEISIFNLSRTNNLV